MDLVMFSLVDMERRYKASLRARGQFRRQLRKIAQHSSGLLMACLLYQSLISYNYQFLDHIQGHKTDHDNKTRRHPDDDNTNTDNCFLNIETITIKTNAIASISSWTPKPLSIGGKSRETREPMFPENIRKLVF